MSNETDTKTEIPALEAAFEAGLRATKPTVIKGGIFSHHKDFKVSHLPDAIIQEAKRLDRGPENPTGTIHVHRPDSFPGVYANHVGVRTAVFADAEERRITSVFDFVEPSSSDPDLGWGQFKAVMNFGLSRKLNQWNQMTEWQSQESFANFLEDHLEDIVAPDAGDLLALATDLEANKEGHFKGKLNLDNGSVKLSYQDEVQTDVEVPRRLTLGIPLFEHGDRFKLECRLRFNVTSGGVRFKILFTNLDDAIDDHFETIVQELEEKMKTSIVRGSLSLKF